MSDGYRNNPGTTVDEALLVACARQSREAFAPLYILYFDRIYAYCYRRLGHPEDAADTTSLIFSRALEAIGSCQTSSFRSWLFAIAHNTLIDVHRGNRFERPIDQVLDLFDHSPSPEDISLQRESSRTVAVLLSQLSDDQRHVLELRLAGLSTREIAAIVGKNENAVDQAQYRAVQRLRRIAGAANPAMEELR